LIKRLSQTWVYSEAMFGCPNNWSILNKREMKIDYQLVTGLSSVCINIASATVGCDTQNLTKPEHWKEWDCDILPMTDSSNEYVISLLYSLRVFLSFMLRLSDSEIYS